VFPEEASENPTSSGGTLFFLTEDYIRLSKVQNPSEQDLDRLRAILDLAQYDSELSSLLNEADHRIADELDLSNDLLFPESGSEYILSNEFSKLLALSHSPKIFAENICIQDPIEPVGYDADDYDVFIDDFNPIILHHAFIPSSLGGQFNRVHLTFASEYKHSDVKPCQISASEWLSQIKTYKTGMYPFSPIPNFLFGGLGSRFLRPTCDKLNDENSGVPINNRVHLLADWSLGHLEQMVGSDRTASYVQSFMVALTSDFLIRYYEATNDSRIIPALEEVMNSDFIDTFIDGAQYVEPASLEYAKAASDVYQDWAIDNQPVFWVVFDDLSLSGMKEEWESVNSSSISSKRSFIRPSILERNDLGIESSFLVFYFFITQSFISSLEHLKPFFSLYLLRKYHDLLRMIYSRRAGRSSTKYLERCRSQAPGFQQSKI